MARLAQIAVLSLMLTSCFATASPVQRVTDAAREMNLATRFGHVDMAVRHVEASIQADFLERRAEWGKGLRILDVELAAIHIEDEEHATVTIDVAWSSVTDSLLRATKLTQDWQNFTKG